MIPKDAPRTRTTTTARFFPFDTTDWAERPATAFFCPDEPMACGTMVPQPEQKRESESTCLPHVQQYMAAGKYITAPDCDIQAHRRKTERER
jgi:hypothetical protein